MTMGSATSPSVNTDNTLPMTPEQIKAVKEEPEGVDSTGSAASEQIKAVKDHNDEKDGSLVPVTQEQIIAVKGQIEEKHHHHCDETTVSRFIRATNHNLPLAAKRLTATCLWRDENKPTEMVCNACAKNPRSHYMRMAGLCNHGRPIIYSCIAMAADKSYETNREHMISTFEMAIKCMTGSVEQWIWVCDFYGFGYKDMNPRLAKLFLEVSANHYPERLGMFMVVGAPALFNVLYNTIEPWVDPKTKNKLRFMPYDGQKKEQSKLLQELQQHFDAPTSAWLMREMEENRDRAAAAKKLYCCREVHKGAKEKLLVKRVQAHVQEGKHHILGCEALLARLEENPGILEPQALLPPN